MANTAERIRPAIERDCQAIADLIANLRLEETGRAVRNLSTRMRQRWFEFKESPRRRLAPGLVG